MNMTGVSNNEMLFILSIFKSPEVEYNANSISKLLSISSMGALKIARRLEKEAIIISRELGKAKFYRLNFESDYVKGYVEFLLKREAEQAQPYVKVWIDEIRKLKSADAAILFGSVLKRYKEAADIDVILVFSEKNFSKLKAEVEAVNQINVKKLHPVYQSRADFARNLSKKDAVLLSAVKGIVVFGAETVIGGLRR